MTSVTSSPLLSCSSSSANIDDAVDSGDQSSRSSGREALRVTSHPVSVCLCNLEQITQFVWPQYHHRKMGQPDLPRRLEVLVAGIGELGPV